MANQQNKRAALIEAQFRTPPHSIEAEQSLLGGLLLSNDAWDQIGGKVNAGDFYRDEHRRIFLQIQRMVEKAKPADVVTVSEALSAAGDGDSTGGLGYLGELAQNTPTTANIGRYAEIVREKSVLRQLIATSEGISAQAYNSQGKDVKELLDSAEASIFQIAEKGASASAGLEHVNPVLSSVIERLMALQDQDNQSGIIGVPTGYDDLDQKTTGLQPGDLIIIGGRPSMGKTSFAINIAEHVAINEGLPVAIFSMEMGNAQLAMRLLSSVGRVDSQRLKTGRLNDDEWSMVSFAMGKINNAPIYMDESGGLNPIELRARARRLARQHKGKLGLIVVDYLQLMATSRTGENRATELSDISRALKSLAKELHCPVIALSQLNRKLEERPDKRPVMSDIRESGAIEQDADVILFLYRDQVYHPETNDAGIAEVIIGKQRNGPLGTVRLAFLDAITRFENLSQFGDRQ